MINRTKIGFISFSALVVLTAASIKAGLGHSTSLVTADGPTTTVAVFRGETLHNLTRLLRPMTYAVPSGPAGNTTLKLRDAIYIDAVGGRARLLTVWLTHDMAEGTLLFSNSDRSKQPSQVADGLAQGSLRGVTFAVIPVEVTWQDWTLSVSRAGPGVVKGAQGISAKLRSAISSAPALVAQADTRSLRIPIGYGETKQTAWQVWFNVDNVVIQIQPTPAGNPSVSPPDTSALTGKEGFVVGDGLLNHIFSNDFKDRLLGGKFNQKSYLFQDIRFAAQGENRDLKGNVIKKATLTATGCYVAEKMDCKSEDPQATKVIVQADLVGSDLKPQALSVPFIECSRLEGAGCALLKGEFLGGAALLTKNIQSNPSIEPLRPEGVQSLGNFFIGTKPLNGTARIDSMQPIDGAVVVTGVFRFFGGHLL